MKAKISTLNNVKSLSAYCVIMFYNIFLQHQKQRIVEHKILSKMVCLNMIVIALIRKYAKF